MTEQQQPEPEASESSTAPPEASEAPTVAPEASESSTVAPEGSESSLAAPEAAVPPSAAAASEPPLEPSRQPSGTSSNLDVIMDLDLPLTVRFGKTRLTLGALVRIGAGSEISLERAPTDPVELMVNGKVIARGDVVAVDGNYAVRITDIVSPSERIANVGG